MWQHVLAQCNNYTPTEIFNDHISNVENPHNVTAEQVGLVNVDNTSDLEKPISNATQEALDNKADLEIFNDHVSNVENPHNVTAEQVGALSIAGGVMEDTITLNGVVLTEGIDYGTGDPSGGVVGQLYFKKVT
jgi:hypothetical protein